MENCFDLLKISVLSKFISNDLEYSSILLHTWPPDKLIISGILPLFDPMIGVPLEIDYKQVLGNVSIIRVGIINALACAKTFL